MKSDCYKNREEPEEHNEAKWWGCEEQGKDFDMFKMKAFAVHVKEMSWFDRLMFLFFPKPIRENINFLLGDD